MSAFRDSTFGITPREVALVRKTIAESCSPHDIAAKLYPLLFELAPIVRPMFADVEAQTTKMAKTILLMVQHLDALPLLEPLFEFLGKRHTASGVNSAMFDTLRIALLTALHQVLGEKFDAEMRRAWHHAFDVLANTLKHHMWLAQQNTVSSRATYVEQFLKPEPFDNVPGGLEVPEAKDVVVQVEGEGEVMVSKTNTLLAATLARGIPHAHECGGNARCSTCRVRIVSGIECCLPRTEAEIEVAKKMHFTEDIRLACQLRFRGPATVRRLLLDSNDVRAVLARSAQMVGRSMNIAVLFCDIRNFTSFVESTLPYDVTHMLNRYFNVVVEAVHALGGYVDKYLGDGIMVLFGLDVSRPSHPALDAVKAAFGIQHAIASENDYFFTHFNTRFQSGIGVAYGPAIVGEVGSWRNSQITALGDVVNVASRIEGLTKELGVQVLVDEAIAHIVQSADPQETQFLLAQRWERHLKGKEGNRVVVELREVPTK